MESGESHPILTHCLHEPLKIRGTLIIPSLLPQIRQAHDNCHLLSPTGIPQTVSNIWSRCMRYFIFNRRLLMRIRNGILDPDSTSHARMAHPRLPTTDPYLGARVHPHISIRIIVYYTRQARQISEPRAIGDLDIEGLPKVRTSRLVWIEEILYPPSPCIHDNLYSKFVNHEEHSTNPHQPYPPFPSAGWTPAPGHPIPTDMPIHLPWMGNTKNNL